MLTLVFTHKLKCASPRLINFCTYVEVIYLAEEKEVI